MSCESSSVCARQVLESEPIHAEDEAARRRREILTRRPSYRKILNELGGGEISEDKGDGDVETQGATGSYQGNGIIKGESERALGARPSACTGSLCRQ